MGQQVQADGAAGELVRVSVQGRVATLTLNRPGSRNALSIELLEAAHARVDELAPHCGPAGGDACVSVVVLTGEGKSFCAGMDLKQVLSDPANPGRLLGLLAEFTLKVRSLPAVVVAKVNGAAIGGGCGLACACDVAVTHADSVMGFPEVDLGVCPAVVAPWLVRKIGAGRARAVLLSGGTMSGSRARDLGMVEHLAESREGLEGVVSEVVSRLASGGPGALAATKGLLNEIDGSLDAALLRRAAALSAEVIASAEAQRTLRARLNG